LKRAFAILAAFVSLQCGAQPITPPPIAARAFIVVDLLSGQTLAAANENDRFEPASLTKLMTAYVAFSAIREGKLGAATAVKPSAEAAKAEGARMFLVAGNPVTVGELLNGMIVDSGNDAAVALAEAIATPLAGPRPTTAPPHATSPPLPPPSSAISPSTTRSTPRRNSPTTASRNRTATACCGATRPWTA
jgi:D-alanyl-D-alanine carboxypeptidase